MRKTRTYIQDYSLKKIPHQLGPFDEQGIPLYNPAQMGLASVWCYHPTVVIQYALACYERLEQGDIYQKGFLTSARWIETHTQPIGATGMLGWAIPFSIRTPAIKAPWFSSLTQSQGISVLVRLYEIERRQETIELIRKVVHTLITDQAQGGMLYQDAEDNFFFEEAGQIHILNGCLTTLYGALEWLSIEKNEELSEVVSKVVSTLEQWLPKYDAGYWSRYSIGLRFNLADMHYHLVHIKQLNELGFLLQNELFLQFARKWAQYPASGFKLFQFLVRRWFIINTGRTLTVLRLNRLKYRD